MLESHLPLLRKVTSTFVLSKEDKEDLIQDVLLEAWKRHLRGQIDPSQNVAGFLIRSLKWRLTDRARKNTKHNNLFSAEENFDAPEEINSPPEEQLEILSQAIEYVKSHKKTRDKHWQMFWHAFKSDDINFTAKHFGVDRSVIDVVKCRIQKKIINQAKELINP